MIGRFMYMLPFIGIIVSLYSMYTNDLAILGVLSMLTIVYIAVCLFFLSMQIMYNGIDGILETEVQLGDAIIPIIFLLLNSVCFLHVILNNLKGVY